MMHSCNSTLPSWACNDAQPQLTARVFGDGVRHALLLMPLAGKGAGGEERREAGAAITCVLVRQFEDLKGPKAQEGGRQAQHRATALSDGLATVQRVPDHARVGCHHAPCTRCDNALQVQVQNKWLAKGWSESILQDNRLLQQPVAYPQN